ncbi:MAG: alpha-L-rhamnosidase C-terminal domain-containing protein, partial [Verrucomicrobiota bacterium]
PSEKRAAAEQNLVHPPEKMVRLGSPFAAFYLYEAYEKLGLQDEIVKDIYHNYVPMIEAGATTVWESYPQGTTGRDQWPTRSHCHAWSAAPVRFFNRIILGVKAAEPGGNAIEISPHLSGLTWAKGKTLTRHGVVEVSWRKEGNRLLLNFKAPQESSASFVKNPSLEGLEIVVNGQTLSK